MNVRLLPLLALACSLAAFGAPTAEDWQADVRHLQSVVHRDYSTLFRKVSAETFDQEADTLFHNLPQLTPHESALGLARLVALFQYGHTSALLQTAPVSFHLLPVNFYAFSDGIFIEGAQSNYAGLVGSRLIAVEGIPIDRVLQAVRKVVPLENEQFFKAYGLGYLAVPEILHAVGVTRTLQASLVLTLHKDGRTFDARIDAGPAGPVPVSHGFTLPDSGWASLQGSAEPPLYLRQPNRTSVMEYLEESRTLYVRQTAIADDPSVPFNAFFASVFDAVEKKDVDRLVLDLRLNGGGNNEKLKPLVVGLIRATKVNRPGKLFVLIGRRTFSACQNLVNELRHYTDAIFVGEPTAENLNFFGDARQVTLPRTGMKVALSFAWWQAVPTWKEQPWLAPQVPVELSSQDFRDRRDPVLAAAISFNAEGFVPDPIGYLSDLFLAGDREKLQREAKRLVNDPRHQFVDYEAEFLRIANQLRDIQQPQAAVSVAEFTLWLFPHSERAQETLGKLQAGLKN